MKDTRNYEDEKMLKFIGDPKDQTSLISYLNND